MPSNDPTDLSVVVRVIKQQTLVFSLLMLPLLMLTLGLLGGVCVLWLEVSDMTAQVASLNDEVAGMKRQLDTVVQSDVIALKAVKMRGSDDWTLPVSAIAWSGR